jgi:hypothetical protein
MVLPPELPRVSTETLPHVDLCFSFAKTNAENRLSGSIWYFAERTARYSPGDTLLRIFLNLLQTLLERLLQKLQRVPLKPFLAGHAAKMVRITFVSNLVL